MRKKLALIAFFFAGPTTVADESVNLLVDPSLETILVSEASEPAWALKEYGHSFERDTEVKQHGAVSIRATSVDKPRGSSLVQALPIELVQNGTHRFSGIVKTEGLKGTALLMLVVNRRDGKRYMDWMEGRSLSGDTDWTTLSLTIPRFDDVESATVSVMISGEGTAWFDALSLRSIDTSIALPDEVSNYIGAALDIMEQNSIRREQVDWEWVRREAKNVAIGATTREEAYPAIKYAVYMLGDRHSSFYSAKVRKARSKGKNQKGNPSVSRLPRGQLIDGRFGYVEIPAFGGTEQDRMSDFANQIQDLIQSMDSTQTCGWIVDLRWNVGGNVFPMLAGIGPVLGEGEAGGGITADGHLIPRSYSGGKSGPATVSREPYSLLRPNPPVAVLFGSKTVSSGEAVALAFLGRPNTRTFGQPSGGLTTGNRQFLMDDGAGLNLSVTKMIDRIGNVYGGKIEPDVRIEGEILGDPSSDATVIAATQWLNNRCS